MSVYVRSLWGGIRRNSHAEDHLSQTQRSVKNWMKIFSFRSLLLFRQDGDEYDAADGDEEKTYNSWKLVAPKWFLSLAWWTGRGTKSLYGSVCVVLMWYQKTFKKTACRCTGNALFMLRRWILYVFILHSPRRKTTRGNSRVQRRHRIKLQK